MDHHLAARRAHRLAPPLPPLHTQVTACPSRMAARRPRTLMLTDLASAAGVEAICNGSVPLGATARSITAIGRCAHTTRRVGRQCSRSDPLRRAGASHSSRSSDASEASRGRFLAHGGDTAEAHARLDRHTHPALSGAPTHAAIHASTYPPTHPLDVSVHTCFMFALASSWTGTRADQATRVWQAKGDAQRRIGSP